jgi:hypothetical protein
MMCKNPVGLRAKIKEEEEEGILSTWSLRNPIQNQVFLS